MQDKAEIRKELLRRRDHIPPAVRRAKNRMISERLLSLREFRDAGTVFLYASFRTEVETADLIQSAISLGKRVVVPKVDKDRHELLLVQINDFGVLTPGCMGIPEPPVNGKQLSINDVDLAIVPGAGFDVSGNRIGYGGGYYDRLLSGMQKQIPVIAPAFGEQIVESIPSEPHDVRVQTIVTDSGIIRCTRPREDQ